MNRALALALVLTVLDSLVRTPMGAQPTSISDKVAVVVRIQGMVYWRQARDKPPKRLDARKDKHRIVFLGEWVKISRGSTLYVTDCNNTKISEEALNTPANGKEQWITFSHRPTADQLGLWNVLTRYADLGGRKKAVSSVFFAPAQDTVVRPDHFTVRWNPKSFRGKVRVVIAEVNPSGKPPSKPIWSQDRVNGRSCKLDSLDARKALDQYRASGRHSQLVLSATGDTGDVKSVQFSLLDINDEQTLQRQLTDMDDVPEPLRSPGRACLLDSFKLINEAADEYDLALMKAPESTALLLAAIVENEQAGNKPREQELRKRLPLGTKVPGD